jgi:phosphohistidine phosphatase
MWTAVCTRWVRDMTGSRRLVVMRHAKAEQEGPTDFERPLSDRGRLEAAAAGDWLSAQGFAPSHALVSAALRTEQTWEAVASGGGWSLSPDLDRGLYAAGPESALDLVRLVPTEVSSLIVIGHNPTMAVLAPVLDDGTGDPAVAAEMVGGFPTSAVAVFSYDGAWADLSEGTARLDSFHVGRA